MPEHQSGFTDRERAVARLLIANPNVVGVAEELNVSPYTVRSHIQEMNAKTRTRTTHELVIWAGKHEICCCN